LTSVVIPALLPAARHRDRHVALDDNDSEKRKLVSRDCRETHVHGKGQIVSVGGTAADQCRLGERR
jgi:hypothetical protein